MGVFRDHIHWRALPTWPIGAVSILLADPGVLRFAEQFVAAILFFVGAAITMLIRVINAAVTSEDSKAIGSSSVSRALPLSSRWRHS